MTSAPAPLPPVRMYWNPPAPLPGQGIHDIRVKFAPGPEPRIASLDVARGSVTYFTSSTNWSFGDKSRAEHPDFTARVDRIAPQLAQAIRELQSQPEQANADGQQNNGFAIRLGEDAGPLRGYSGHIAGGTDAGDAVSALLRQLASDAKSSLPSYRNGPG